MEIRLHGRGGQGGVTCAKLLAAIYDELGQNVQAFGDYAGERSGAPIRAYTRVSDQPILNRNKVYSPDHLLVLDPTLLDDTVLSGLKPGGMLLLNTPRPAAELAARFPGHRVAAVDATEIARRHGIGSRSVVIVNTTIAGAFARAMDLPEAAVEAAYSHLGLAGNLPAAREAFASVEIIEAPAQGAEEEAGPAAAASPWGASALGPVADLVELREGPAPTLKTGAWRSQTPRYMERPAPCNVSCPAGNDVVRFVQALWKEGPAAAAAVLAETTPLPGVCGRVCPAPCMTVCNRAELDEAINIRAIERYVADHAGADHAEQGVQVRGTPQVPRRIAIVGSGPAGLSAAWQLARAGHAVRLIEKDPVLGGVLAVGIPSYRLPRDVLAREIQRVLDLGVEVEHRAIDGEGLRVLAEEMDGVILATGLQRLTGLSMEGQDLDGVEQGIDFLRRMNLHETAHVQGHVVVLGGGNTAMDCARTALRAGASRVTVVYRRTRAEMPAIVEEIEEAEAEGVHFLFLRGPQGAFGQDRVGGLELSVMQLGPPDESGRQRPVDTGGREWLDCDTVLLALGQDAESGILPRGWRIEGDRVFSDRLATPILLAGDMGTRAGTVTHAIGDGRRVALALLRALGEALPVSWEPRQGLVVTKSDLQLSHFERAPRSEGGHLPPELRAWTWEEVNQGLLDRSEAGRCFSCGLCTECDTCLVYCPEGIIRRRPAAGATRVEPGAYAVDYSTCKGCGICVTECPRGAITMEAL